MLETILKSDASSVGLTEKMQETPFCEVLKAFDTWRIHSKLKVIKSEEYCWSEEHGYAGRYDLLAEIDGKKALIDFKTLSGDTPYDSHWMQLMAYYEALSDETGGDDGKDVYCLIFQKKSEDKDWGFFPHKLDYNEYERYWQMFYHLLEFYKIKNKK